MLKVKVYKVGDAVEANVENYRIVGNQEVAIIEKDSKVIIIENDACHCVKDLNEKYTVGVVEKKENFIALMPSGYIDISVEAIINGSENIKFYETTLPEWIIYYKIKSRIIDNCNLLKKTMKENGIDYKEYFN